LLLSEPSWSKHFLHGYLQLSNTKSCRAGQCNMPVMLCCINVLLIAWSICTSSVPVILPHSKQQQEHVTFLPLKMQLGPIGYTFFSPIFKWISFSSGQNTPWYKTWRTILAQWIHH
jgi:hypothetical protein